MSIPPQRLSISTQSALLNAAQLFTMVFGVLMPEKDRVLGVSVVVGGIALVLVGHRSLRCPHCNWPAMRRKVTSASIRTTYAWPPAKCPNCGTSFYRRYRPVEFNGVGKDAGSGET